MAYFPSSPYSPRTISNRSGVVYDADDEQTLFAEDLEEIQEEITAIENYLKDPTTVPIGGIAEVHGEELSGAINGSNTAFTSAHLPVAGLYTLFANGIRMRESVDYTRSGSTFTFVSALLDESQRPVLDYKYIVT